MDSRQLKRFRSLLENRKRSLQNSASRSEVEGRTLETASTSDVADRADENYFKEFLFSLSENDRQLLRLVESALRRIDSGDFGQCASCGNVIESKRLQAVPWAAYCLRCQQRLEQQHLQPRYAS
jgi:DnaK suppressor protein